MTDSNFALTSLYHPSGAKVSIPIDPDYGISPERSMIISRSVDALIGAGFTVTAPGLEAGEVFEEIASVAKRADKDGVPIVAFYSSHPKLLKKILHKYLDTPEDVAAFERATGLKVSALPMNDSDKDIDRDNKNAAKYIIPLPRPIRVAWRISERWEKWKAEGGEGQEPQKRILARYDGQPAAAAQQPAQKSTVKADPQTGEVITPRPSLDGDGKEYPKMSGEIVNFIVAQTGLKPAAITPILAGHPAKVINQADALAFVQLNLPKE